MLVGAMAFAGGLALAEEPAKKSAKKAKSAAPVDSSSLDKRVAEAPAIFVANAVRIYFVDRRHQEVPYIRAAGEGSRKNALMLLKVTKVLHPANANVPERVVVPLETTRDVFGDGKSLYEQQTERYVGKQAVWFGEVKVVRDFSGDGSGRKPLEDPVNLLVTGDAKRKQPATISPVPIEQLKDVESSIARIKAEGGSRKAEN